MNRFTVGLLALLCCVAPLRAAETPLTPAEPYELHEWGVFSVPRNAVWSQMDMRAEWATFPNFFYRVWPDKRHRSRMISLTLYSRGLPRL